MYYFYILKSCSKANYYYKGSTNDLIRRFREYNYGEVHSSKPYRPYKLVYYEAYDSESAARHREKSIKKSGAVWGALMKRVRNEN